MTLPSLTNVGAPALVGVSGQSIYHREAGKARPRAGQLEALAAIRSVNAASCEEERAEAWSYLAALPNLSLLCAVAVAVARIYFERPAVPGLIIVAVVAFSDCNISALQINSPCA